MPYLSVTPQCCLALPSFRPSQGVPQSVRRPLGPSHARHRLWACVATAILVLGLTSELAAQPANDTCIGAQLVAEGSFAFDTSTATPSLDPHDDAQCAGSGLGDMTRDLWFHYTATVTGLATIDTCNSFDTDLVVYTGTCGALAQAACNGDSCGLSSSLSLSVVSGGSYRIRIGGYDLAEFGAGMLGITVQPQAANDECGMATLVGEGSFPFDTTSATNSAALFDTAQCSFTFPGGMLRDVWFLYTASVTGDVTIDTCNSFDTDLAVYTGGCGALAQVACNGDDCGVSSSLVLTVTSGTSYLIRIGGFDALTGGAGTLTIAADEDSLSNLACHAGALPDAFTLTWAYPPGSTATMVNIYSDEGGPQQLIATVNAPATSYAGTVALTGVPQIVQFCVEAMGTGTAPQVCCQRSFNPAQNDACSQAQPIGDGLPAVIGGVFGASSDGVSACGGNGNPDVWFVYTPTCNGEVAISTCGTHDAPGADLGMDTILAVYDACSGLELACSDDWSGGPGAASCAGLDAGLARDSAVSLLLPAGHPVWVRVTHFGSAVSNATFRLNIACTPAELPVTQLTCQPGPTGDDFVLSWADPAGSTATTLHITSDETGTPILIASLPAGTNTFSGSLAFPGQVTTVTLCVEVVGTLGTSRPVCCEQDFNVATNDDCTDAIVLDSPADARAFDSTVSSTDGLPLALGACVGWIGDDQIYNDLWYSYTPASSGTTLVTTCFPGGFDTKLAIYVDSGVCPPPNTDLLRCNDNGAGCPTLTSQMSVLLMAGTDYLIRVGGFGPFQAGPGLLAVGPECAAVHGLSATYNAMTDSVQLTWVDSSPYVSLAVTADGLSLGAPSTPAGMGMPGSRVHLNPPVGTVTYEVTATCVAGGMVSAQVQVDTDSAGAFVRGNCNGLDGSVNIADAVYLLGNLFPAGGNPPNALLCRDACDANDDGAVNIADAIALLASLFGSPATPLAPPNTGTGCGVDPTPADPLDCLASTPGC